MHLVWTVVYLFELRLWLQIEAHNNTTSKHRLIRHVLGLGDIHFDCYCLNNKVRPHIFSYHLIGMQKLSFVFKQRF